MRLDAIINSTLGLSVLQLAVFGRAYNPLYASQEKTRVPAGIQRLIYGGKELNEHQTVMDCGLEAGSTIHLVLRLRGGKGGFGSLLRSAGMSIRGPVQELHIPLRLSLRRILLHWCLDRMSSFASSYLGWSSTFSCVWSLSAL